MRGACSSSEILLRAVPPIRRQFGSMILAMSFGALMASCSANQAVEDRTDPRSRLRQSTHPASVIAVGDARGSGL